MNKPIIMDMLSVVPTLANALLFTCHVCEQKLTPPEKFTVKGYDYCDTCVHAIGAEIERMRTERKESDNDDLEIPTCSR